MSSVWKRLQRVGKNASKFQFTASFESLTVECEKSGKWQPNKLSIVWTRRKRRMCTKLHTWNPGISNPFRGVIVWAEPEDLEMSVTLYKDSRPGSPYEDKEWSFIIEDESTTGRRKPIAHVTINMVEYASMEFTTKDVSLKLKLSSKKLVYASLDFQMSCVLIKEGKATDEDMISIGSMMSLNEIGSVRDFEIEPQIATPQPVRSYKRALSGGYSLPRAKSFGKKDHSESTESAQNMSPVQLKRTRSKSTTPSFNKYSVSDSKDTYMVDRRLSSASQVSMDGDDTWDVIKDMSNAEGDLIKWCRTCTKGYKGVKIKNTTTSWRDGLAFCAILHHFHPNLIDFSSLDSENIKENNKLAFDGFEKLGIARLLDPTTMAITSVPDKLSMITYLFQIKTHFTKPEIPVTHRKHKHFKLFRKHGSSSDSYKVKNKEPKLDIIATVSENVDENESSTSGVERNVDDFSMTRDKVDEPENHLVTRPRDEVKSEDVTEHATVKRKDDEIKIEMADDDEAKRKSGYNPFEDEDENEFKIDIVEDDPPKTAIIEVKNERIERSVSPQKEYNPFDDEEDEPESPTNRLADIITETKQGYNPFDSESDDNPASPTETKTNAQATVNTVTAEERLGYNPFDDKEEEVGEPSAGSGETSGSTRGYNPFDDEDDDEPERPTKVEPDKPSFRRTRLTASGRKIKLPAPKPRGAPYRPQQDKPTALPRNASSLASRQNAGDTSVTRRKLPPNPKPRPSRPAPRPPGMAPKETNKPAASIPTFDEWKKAGTLRDQSPAGRTTPNSLSLIRSDDKTRSVSPSGRVFQSRRPAPKPPGKQPGITHEKDKVTEQPGITQEKDKVTEDTDGTTDESGKTENEMKEKIGKDSEESKETIKPDINETEGNNEVKEKISEPNLDEQETKETLKTQNEIKENEKVDESEIMMKTENQKNDTDTEKEKPIILSKDSEENTEEIASKKEDKDSKGGDNADIKVLARQVLMEARKKAGACSALPRDRLAMSTSQATADSSDASEGSVSTSPKLSKKSNQEEQDGSRRSSRGAKPAKPPKPSSLHEKIKAESERQSRLTEKSRESLESRRKRDTEVDESKQRQSLSKANSLITHSQQRDRKKESSNESLSKESPCDSTLEKKEEEPKLERSSSHVMGHRPLKMKFKKDKEEGSSESLEKPDKYEESDNIKRLRAVLNEGNDGKDNEGSGSESEQIKATNSDADSPAPTPPRRTSQSYQQKRHNRLSSSGSDTSVSSKTMSQNDKKSNATKPINTSSKTPQESPGDGVSASTSPSKKGFASSKTISQNDKKSNATKPIDIPSKTPQESPGDGVSASTSPSKKGFVSRAAAVQAYAESRKMKFEEFALPPGPPSSQPPPPPKPPRTMVYEEQEGPSNVKNNKTTEEQNKKEEESDDDAQNTLEDEMNKSIGSADSSDLQDTSEYVKQELEALAQEQAALDKVAAKLEKELRGAMKNKGCEEEEEKLLQSWFILVDKKNELVRRQTELSILEKEDDLERRYEMLNRELRGLLSKEEWEKTEEDKELEANLLQELVVLVNKRDQLVQIEDTQLQQMERDEKHIRQVVQSAQLSQNKSDCVLQ